MLKLILNHDYLRHSVIKKLYTSPKQNFSLPNEKIKDELSHNSSQTSTLPIANKELGTASQKPRPHLSIRQQLVANERCQTTHAHNRYQQKKLKKKKRLCCCWCCCCCCRADLLVQARRSRDWYARDRVACSSRAHQWRHAVGAVTSEGSTPARARAPGHWTLPRRRRPRAKGYRLSAPRALRIERVLYAARMSPQVNYSCFLFLYLSWGKGV